MWVEKTKDGNFKFREQYKNPLTGKYSKVSVTMDKATNINKRKAQIMLEKKIQKKLKYIQDGNIKKGVTLGEVIDEWEPVYKKQVVSGTFVIWEQIKEIVERKIGLDTLVAKITPKFLTNVYEDLLYKENKSASYVRSIKSKVHIVLQYAYKHDYLAKSPVSNLPINWSRKKNTSTVEANYLDDNELKMVLDFVYQRIPIYGAILEWQFYTGMRFGEAAVLQIKNIHKENGKYFADVTGTEVYHGLDRDEFYKSPLTKTEASRRTVFLPKQAVRIFKNNSLNKVPDGFLFTHKGTLLSVNSVNSELRIAKRKLHIEKKLSTHTMRHTHVSKLAELGVPLYIIQERVGHSSSKITEQVYLHVTKKAKVKYNKLIDQL